MQPESASSAATPPPLTDAFAYAGQKGMKVVNGSFGTSFSQIIADAIANAPNTLFVFAAGNDGTARQQRHGARLSVPVPVAKHHLRRRDGPERQPGSFSNYGTSNVDLAAPGDVHREHVADVRPVPGQLPSGRFRHQVDHRRDEQHVGTRLCIAGNCLMTDSPAGNYLNNTNSFARTTDCDQHHRHDRLPSAEFLINWNLANDGDTLVVEASTNASTWSTAWSFTSAARSAAGSGWCDGDRPFDNLPTLYLRWRLLTRRVRGPPTASTSTTSRSL